MEIRRGLGLREDRPQGVDDWVAGQEDPARLDPLSAQGRHVPGRGREMERGEPGDELPIQLLGIGIIAVSRAEACLHMADRLRTIERELSSVKERVDQKSRELTILLDQAID